MSRGQSSRLLGTARDVRYSSEPRDFWTV